jgi:hypothetical protein
MANTLAEDKHYKEKKAVYEAKITEFIQSETKLLEECRQNPATAAEKLLLLSDSMLNLVSYYLVIDGLSHAVKNTRDEKVLEDARKAMYKSIIYLENIVTGGVEIYFDEYKDKLAELAAVSTKRRYDHVRKMGLTIKLLQNAFGDNSKWRWSFVEMEGRFAAVAKNIFDLGRAVTNSDPSCADYEPTVRHIQLLRKILFSAATRYRERYELSTYNIEDLKTGLHFMNALRYINITLGNSVEAEKVKKQCESFEVRIEAASKKK